MVHKITNVSVRLIDTLIQGSCKIENYQSKEFRPNWLVALGVQLKFLQHKAAKSIITTPEWDVQSAQQRSLA